MNLFMRQPHFLYIYQKFIMPENLQLKKGENHVLQLKGLATAGYEWGYTIENEKIVSVQKQFVATDQTEKKLAGASANESFTITGLQKGSTQVHFKQARSWETGNSSNEKQVTVTVI